MTRAVSPTLTSTIKVWSFLWVLVSDLFPLLPWDKFITFREKLVRSVGRIHQVDWKISSGKRGKIHHPPTESFCSIQ